MARRIGLAQALINDPDLLILDEPTSGLDPIGARQIKDVIRELGDKGKTILLSSHVLADVEDVCDRVTILYGGQQRAVGDIGELLRKREITQITTPTLAEETIQQIADLIQRTERKNILSVSHPRQRLEEFFLRMVREAQAANVRTSGTTGEGALPEFLSSSPEATTAEVVESLVSAATQVIEPTPAPSSPAPDRTADPGRDVLQELLGAPTAEADEGPEEPSAPTPSPPPPSTRQSPSGADQSVIDDLIQRTDDKSGERDESSS